MLTESQAPELRNRDWPRRLVLWAAGASLVFLCFWYVFDIILLTLAGALLAIVIHTFSLWVQNHTPKVVGPKLSSTATIAAIVILASAVGYWIVPRAIVETGEISHVIPKSLDQLNVTLDKTNWGRYIEHAIQRSMGKTDLTSKLAVLANDVGAALERAIVILVIGLYGALNAREYTRGLLEFIPEQKRQRFATVSLKVVNAMRWWLIGQLVPMTVLGVGTMLGLWALGVPLAFTLGLFTGLMIFMPYVGSWIAFIPTVLVSLTVGVHTAIYVTLLYVVIHGIEGYVLTPLVQKRVVLLPPVLTILAQLFMWKVSGFLGLALATPIAAASLVLVKTLYLHDRGEGNRSTS
jgi:predicted PurR-regulated permease PerM